MKTTDESTIISNNGANSEKENKTENPNKNVFWKGVVVGGVPGLLLGSVGTVFASGNTKEVNAEEVIDDVKDVEQAEDVDEVAVLKEEVAALKDEVADLREDLSAAQASSHIHVIGDTVAVAHGVSDDMSFSEAFAAARAEVGPGGVFTWHGNVYGTYYANEWNSMSDEQKAEYSQAVHNTDYNAEEYAHNSHTSSGSSSYHDAAQDGGEIRVLETETVETEDGTINVARVEVNGHYGEIYDLDNNGTPDVALIDSNDDGRPDIAMVDENGDGMIDESEVYMDPNLTTNALYDDMPDYSNDADASSFI
jgi:hypothetical protein